MNILQAKQRLLASYETPLTQYHGHVVPLPNGLRTKCGGPNNQSLGCVVCAREQDLFNSGKHPLISAREREEFKQDLKQTFADYS